MIGGAHGDAWRSSTCVERLLTVTLGCQERRSSHETPSLGVTRLGASSNSTCVETVTSSCSETRSRCDTSPLGTVSSTCVETNGPTAYGSAAASPASLPPCGPNTPVTPARPVAESAAMSATPSELAGRACAAAAAMSFSPPPPPSRWRCGAAFERLGWVGLGWVGLGWVGLVLGWVGRERGVTPCEDQNIEEVEDEDGSAADTTHSGVVCRPPAQRRRHGVRLWSRKRTDPIAVVHVSCVVSGLWSRNQHTHTHTHKR